MNGGDKGGWGGGVGRIEEGDDEDWLRLIFLADQGMGEM
jgi:hypothetical protein